MKCTSHPALQILVPETSEWLRRSGRMYPSLAGVGNAHLSLHLCEDLDCVASGKVTYIGLCLLSLSSTSAVGSMKLSLAPESRIA